MADSKSESKSSVSVIDLVCFPCVSCVDYIVHGWWVDKKEVKSPNFVERAKEEFEAMMHHHKENRGMKHNGIDENTSIEDIKAPNVFERVKEEFEAIADALHRKKESPTHEGRDENKMAESKEKQKIPCSSPSSENNAKKPNILVKAKEEIESIIHHVKSPHHHHKETHGLRDDIDENTPTDEVKAPNVFERVIEEFEAAFEAMNAKKDD
ncbi:DEAD-box ATP-dependent RNA helicase [Senna tora]|uniref:DEAD-box ATP-dependent RNA helicase n=1 Tax=Senna tora TaxID=362788 RepID=A0A834SLL4_9FABA|nr:DEAD-box ATP-dependent RNA helicase [Senna tora]